MNKYIKIAGAALIVAVIVVLITGYEREINRFEKVVAELEAIEPEVVYIPTCNFDSINPKDNLYSALVALKVPHPEIVLRQAVLETGHFQSNYMKKSNNLFGIMNSNGKLATYSHWIESVVAYKKYFSSRYKGGDYYEFLKKCNYASDPNYIKKLKQVDVKPYIQ